MTDAYATQLKTGRSIFSTTPIYHIVPEENTITFASAINYTDVLIAPKGYNAADGASNLPTSLSYDGWSGAPYVGFSGNHFGLGFTASNGYVTSEYRAGSSTDESIARFSGVGFFGYYSTTLSVLPKSFVFSLFAGGTTLSALHEESNAFVNIKYRYGVTTYTSGLNIGIHLAKRFTWIPWIDYSTNRVGTPEFDGRTSTSSNDELEESIDLYWRSTPSLRYGIDFAVEVWGLDIHFGGILGALGNITNVTRRIEDNSNQMSFSISMKGG
ncbi:MAG: hypothetical protein FJ146_11160 [Deltaproteobacteria bacterium]|nr:hypothetical protein [Deltaproteobacteria bacterium]